MGGDWKLEGGGFLYHTGKLHWFAVKRNVVYSVPFRPEWTENLVSICKPIRGNPPFHLGSNFGCFESFRVFRWVSGHFGQFTFWEFFFFSFLSTSLISLPLVATSQQSSLSLSSELTTSSLQQGHRFPPHLRPARLQLLPRRPLPAMRRICLCLCHRSTTLQHHLRQATTWPWIESLPLDL